MTASPKMGEPRLLRKSRIVAAILLLFCAHLSAKEANTSITLPWIVVSSSGDRFLRSDTGTTFTPWGFNYDRDHKMRLLEEYWDQEWSTVVEDFREMKSLGANVVRIHLQFSEFMDAPDKPNQKSLSQLSRIIKLAEETQLYVDITGLACYRKNNVPPWYTKATEGERWAAQEAFWEAIALQCKDSPAIFFYNLMNEPFVPDKPRTAGEWTTGELAGFSYVQAITLDPAGRPRGEVATQWVKRMAKAIRKYDSCHLISLGMLPDAASGFDPSQIGTHLDFTCLHIYPNSSTFEKDMSIIKAFKTTTPLIVEEIFPMFCKQDELTQFMRSADPHVAGWISFYWGQSLSQLDASGTIPDKILLEWIKTFRQFRPASIDAETK